MKWKIQWFVYHDPRFDLRYAFCQGPFDRLKDAKAFVATLEDQYYEIVRQEYSGFRYGTEKVVERGKV